MSIRVHSSGLLVLSFEEWSEDAAYLVRGDADTSVSHADSQHDVLVDSLGPGAHDYRCSFITELDCIS